MLGSQSHSQEFSLGLLRSSVRFSGRHERLSQHWATRPASGRDRWDVTPTRASAVSSRGGLRTFGHCSIKEVEFQERDEEQRQGTIVTLSLLIKAFFGS